MEDPEKQSHPGCCDILYYTRLHGITRLIPPAWPLQCGVAPSLPEVPRGRARDGLLLPDGLQPLRPGGHHPLSFFFGRHFRTKTDLRGKDFKSAEVQRAVLQCKEGSAVRSRPLLSHPGNARSWPPGSSENLPPPASRECGRCPAASGPGRSATPRTIQAGILERVAYSFSRGSSKPRNQTRDSCIAGGFFTN